MITKNFIKMCRKAEDIQKVWKPKIGDKYYNIKGKYNCFLTELSFRQYLPHKVGFWLPTQEQLQEMVFSERAGVQTIATAMEQFSKSDIGCSISIMGDMNELWLAFAMKEKYNKVWNCKKWVIIK